MCSRPRLVRGLVLFLSACLVLTAAQAQVPGSYRVQRASVITDAKGNPKAIRLEFVVTANTVIEQVSLDYRKSDDPTYRDLRLKLNHELNYETYLPYSNRIECYLTIIPERGAAFTLGSAEAPEVIESEDLARESQQGHTTLKKVVIIGTIGVIAVIAAIFFRGRARQGPNPLS
jgi:hypothetical protein